MRVTLPWERYFQKSKKPLVHRKRTQAFSKTIDKRVTCNVISSWESNFTRPVKFGGPSWDRIIAKPSRRIFLFWGTIMLKHAHRHSFLLRSQAHRIQKSLTVASRVVPLPPLCLTTATVVNNFCENVVWRNTQSNSRSYLLLVLLHTTHVELTKRIRKA